MKISDSVMTHSPTQDSIRPTRELSMRLACLKGKDKGLLWELRGDSSVIGRNSLCDVSLSDPKVSRIHAEVVREGESFLLHDRNSRNGSYVNGNRVTSQRLIPGDVIKLGNTTIKVVDEEPAKQASRQESNPSITHEIPLDQLSTQIRDFVSVSGKVGREKPNLARGSNLHAAKLVKKLETIYQVGNVINSIQTVDEMLGQIASTMLKVFQGAQRVCILLNGKRKETDFEPKIIKTRVDVPPEPFELSRSIIKKAVNEKVCILADDASSDERFSGSDSVLSINIRSMMCAPLINKGIALGLIYLDNRKKRNCFDHDDMALLSALANQSAIAIKNSLLYEDVQNAYHEAILALMNTMDAKDTYTRGHSKRTSRYALGIAQEMGLSAEECKKIQTAAELHDIGKIGVKDMIIGKDSALSTMEFSSIQTHVLNGENIIRPIEHLRFALPMVRHHHENYDGTGYPDGLKGDQIPLGARIIAVADAFDAMTSKRPYNRPVQFKEAVKKAVSLKGKQFDPDVIDALVRLVEKNNNESGGGDRLSDEDTEDMSGREKLKPGKKKRE